MRFSVCDIFKNGVLNNWTSVSAMLDRQNGQTTATLLMSSKPRSIPAAVILSLLCAMYLVVSWHKTSFASFSMPMLPPKMRPRLRHHQGRVSLVDMGNYSVLSSMTKGTWQQHPLTPAEELKLKAFYKMVSVFVSGFTHTHTYTHTHTHTHTHTRTHVPRSTWQRSPWKKHKCKNISSGIKVPPTTRYVCGTKGGNLSIHRRLFTLTGKEGNVCSLVWVNATKQGTPGFDVKNDDKVIFSPTPKRAGFNGYPRVCWLDGSRLETVDLSHSGRKFRNLSVAKLKMKVYRGWKHSQNRQYTTLFATRIMVQNEHIRLSQSSPEYYENRECVGRHEQRNGLSSPSPLQQKYETAVKRLVRLQ